MMLLVLKSSGLPVWLPFVVAAGVAFIALMFLLQRYYERKRSAELEAAATQAGLSFQVEGDPLPADAAAGLHLFSLGHSQRSRNIMRGSAGHMDTVVFDYMYVTGSGKSRSEHRQTVAAFRLAGATLPGFTLGQETFFHKIAALFGYHDINFPEHPEFSRRYLLRGADEAAIRNLFSSALIDFFETLAAGEKWWSVEGNGEWLLVFHPERKMKPAELLDFLQQTTKIASSFRTGTGAAKFGW